LIDVDVVIPVRNAGSHLQRAVDSILDQEGVSVRVYVVDDGSTDSAPDGLREDTRVVVLRATGHGIPAALEQGIGAGTAPFVARQDADDVSLPGRLAAEVAHLEEHAGIGLVATAFEVVVGRRTISTMVVGPAGLPMTNPFCAGSVMVRRTVHEQAGGYRSVFACSSDYDMWLRCAEVSGVSVLPVAGYRYRLTADMTTIRRAATQAAFAELARASARARRANAPDPAIDPAAAEAFVAARTATSESNDPEVYAWWAREFAALGDRREAGRCLQRAAAGLPVRRLLPLALQVIRPGRPQAVWA
jgi:glycosyltransferase involved in cell wall biosynthesis